MKSDHSFSIKDKIKKHTQKKRRAIFVMRNYSYLMDINYFSYNQAEIFFPLVRSFRFVRQFLRYDEIRKQKLKMIRRWNFPEKIVHKVDKNRCNKLSLFSWVFFYLIRKMEMKSPHSFAVFLVSHVIIIMIVIYIYKRKWDKENEKSSGPSLKH